jgi:hypothetical protein
MRWSRLSSLLRRLLNQVVDPRLTEILVEVAHIALGASDACPSRVGILAGARARPLDGGARAAAAFASGRLVVLYAPTSLHLPAAVAGIGVRLGFRGRLCSLPGPRTPLPVVLLRTGPGRGLARLAVLLVPRPGPGRGLARLAVLVPRPGPRLAVLLVPRPGPRLAVLLVPGPGPSPGFVAPAHAFGWASVEGHGARRPEKQADGEECRGGTGTCGRRCEGHCGKYQGGSTGRTHENLHWGMDGFTSAMEVCRIMAGIDVTAITKWSISCQKVRITDAQSSGRF